MNFFTSSISCGREQLSEDLFENYTAFLAEFVAQTEEHEPKLATTTWKCTRVNPLILHGTWHIRFTVCVQLPHKLSFTGVHFPAQ